MPSKDGKAARVQRLSRDHYGVYLRRAQQFAHGMRGAMEARQYTLAGLCAVHCTISLCDALSVFHLGERSRGQDHHEVVGLVGRARLDGWGARAAQVVEILAMKNAFEYEDRDPTEGDVRRSVVQTERFFRWATGHLPG